MPVEGEIKEGEKKEGEEPNQPEQQDLGGFGEEPAEP